VEVFKKGDHANKNNQMDGRKMAQLINEEEDRKRIIFSYTAPTMPQDLRIAIAQARNSKSWTQEQFAHLVCFPKSDVNSW
jgi:DNA-binding transcriptional regulator YiaG